MLKLGLCVALLLVPLLLLSSPRIALSKAATNAPRVREPGARASTRREASGAPVTPWITAVVLVDDIVHSASAVTTTTSPPPEIVRHEEPTTTTTSAPPPAPTTTAPPPPPTTTTTAPPPAPAPRSPANVETGEASWYSAPAGTCASPDLAFGTILTVTDVSNGSSTTCTVEDRGPSVGGRILDLSEANFSQIADPSEGVIEVRVSWS
jgi:rare lipoprotein A (peptidoglycan hydrolase)